MEIELGKDIISIDGKRLGTVERFVIDTRTWELDEIIVHHDTLFGDDRIVETSFVSRVDSEGSVYIGVAASDADRQLPRFVEESYMVMPPDRRTQRPAAMSTGEGDLTAIVRPRDASGTGYARRARPLFETQVTPEPRVEMRSNLTVDDVIVSRGTRVEGSGGERLGSLDGVHYQDAEITEISVRAGRFSRDVVVFPIEMIESMTHDTVRLNATADDVLRRT